MPKQGVVDIGIQVEYQKALQEMTAAFKQQLAQISREAKKTGFSVDIRKQIEEINAEVEHMASEFSSSIDALNNGKIDTSKFTESFDGLEKKITNINDRIDNLYKKFDGSDVTDKMKKRFDELIGSLSTAHRWLKEVVDLTQVSGKSAGSQIDKSGIEEYRKILEDINAAHKEIEDLDPTKMKFGAFVTEFNKQKEVIADNIALYKSLKRELSEMADTDPGFAKKEQELMAVSTALYKAKGIFDQLFSNNQKDYITTNDIKLFSGLKNIEHEVGLFENKIKRIVNKNQELQHVTKDVQETFDTFKVKNGAIHVQVDIEQTENLKEKLNGILTSLQTVANERSIIAKVRLTLDKSGSKGYITNDALDKQIEEGQNEPALDITKSIKNSYREATRAVQNEANAAIKSIQAIFNEHPIKITPDKQNFAKELSKMINSSLKKVSEETTGLNVNKQLTELIDSLKETSASLSGSDGLKFGLDEESINRITNAIESMANMIKRAFGVASDSDIAAQWSAIEEKFRSVAGEEGKLLAGNKEHKAVIQELAVEYKKYLDMGGTNELSGLTKHTQTVKNITKAYEKLNVEAKETQDAIETNVVPKNADVRLTPTVDAFKSDAERLLAGINLRKEIEIVASNDIAGVRNSNQALEKQADKTATALQNEGDVSASASSKFRKLAKEKGAAVVANRELAKAAKETTIALKQESEAQKEHKETKPNKNAVDGSTYENNYSKWQSDIKQSLLDGGYAEVYEAQISQAANGIVKFTAYVRELDGEWQKYTATVDKFGNVISPKLKEATDKQKASIEKQQEALRRAQEQLANMGIEEDNSYAFNQDELREYVNLLERAGQKLEGIKIKKIALNDDGSLSITAEFEEANNQVSTFTAKFKSIDSVMDVAENAVKDLGTALRTEFDAGQATMSLTNFSQKANDLLTKFTKKNESNTFFRYIIQDLEKLKSDINSISNLEGFEKWKNDLLQIGTELKNLGNDDKLGKKLIDDKSFADIQEVRNNLDLLFASIGKVNEKSIRIKNMNSLTVEIQKANGEIHEMSVNLDSKGFVRYVDTGIKQFSRLREAAESVFRGIKSFVRIYLSPYDFIRYFRQGFDSIKEVDTAMTELRKVSDSSGQDLADYFNDAIVSSKELGSSVNEMISATADWSRMGYNLPDSKTLGELAVLYKNVGDGISVDDANSSLISTLQGFQMNANEAIDIIDAFNEVSNNFAISSGGIGEALTRSAAAFHVANTDLNKSIALVTATNEVIQNPEKVGTLYQTVSARIRGAKTELEAMGGDTDDMVESTSKLRDLVKSMTGFDIMKDEDTYKDIYEIIMGIGKEWDKLKDIDRAALLEALAGKRQSNALAAVLSNIEGLEGAYETAEDSAGSAMREQEKYSQSLQYSLDQIKAHGEEFWTTFLKKEDVKIFIDFLNKVIKFGTTIVDIFGSIPTVAGILAGFGSIKNIGIFRTFENDLEGLTNKVGFSKRTFAEWGAQVKEAYDTADNRRQGFFRANKTMFVAPNADNGIKLIEQSDFSSLFNVQNADDFFNRFNKNGSSSIATLTTWCDEIKVTDKTMRAYLEDCMKNKVPASFDGYNNYVKQATVNTKQLTFGMKALSLAGNMLATMAISAAISLIIKGFYNLANAQENAIEKADEFLSEFKETMDSLKSQSELIDSISEDYSRLAQGVDVLGNNISLSTNEYEKYNDIANQIAELFPHMIQGYTDEGNAIIRNKGNIEELTQAYKDNKKAAQDAIIVGSADVFKGFKATTDIDPEFIWEESGLLQMKELVGKIVATGGDVERIQDVIDELGGKTLVIGDVFDKIGLDKGWFDWNTLDAEYISENIKKFQPLFDILNAEIDAQAAKITPIIQAYLDNSFDEKKLDDTSRDFVKKMLASLDYQFFSEFDTETEMMAWFDEYIIKNFKEGSDISKAYTLMFDMQTQFNNSEISYGEYVQQVVALLNSIKTLPDEEQKRIALIFGVTMNEDGSFTTEKDYLINKIKGMLGGDDAAKSEWLNHWTLEDLEIAANMEVDGQLDWSDFEAKFLKEKEKIQNSTKDIEISFSKLKTVAESLSPLQDVLNDISNDGYVTADTLAELSEKFASVEDAEKYIKTLSKAKKGSKEFNEAMTLLTYGFIENQFTTEQLANADAQLIVNMLRSAGVSNAVAVAQDMIAKAKEKVRIETSLAKDISAKAIDALIAEGSQCGLTKLAFEDLVLEIGIFNNSKLDVDDKIAKLQELGYFARLTGDILAAVNDGGSVKYVTVGNQRVIAAYDKDGKLISSERLKDFSQEDINSQNGVTTDYTSESIKDKEREIQEKKEQISLDRLKSNLEKRKFEIDRYVKEIDRIDFGIDYFDSSNYQGKADLLSDKYDVLLGRGRELREEFDRVSSMIPTTAEEALEIANRVEELGSDMRDNLKTLRETIVEIQKVRIEAMKVGTIEIKTDITDSIDGIMSAFDMLKNPQNRNKKFLDTKVAFGGLFDSIDSLRDEFDKRKEHDEKLIELEKDTQEAINAIVADAQKRQAEETEKNNQRELAKLEKNLQEVTTSVDDTKNSVVEDVNSMGDSVNTFGENTEDMSKKVVDATSAVATAFDNAKNSYMAYVKYVNGNPVLVPYTSPLGLPNQQTQWAPFPSTMNTSTTPSGKMTHVQLASFFGGLPTSGFGNRNIGGGASTYHPAYDFGFTGEKLIPSPVKGTVIVSDETSGNGNYVVIQTNDGAQHYFLHMSKRGVSKGQKVDVGTVLGLTGKTGTVVISNPGSTTLDYRIKYNGSFINPSTYNFSAYSSGTKDHPGGVALVGDGNLVNGKSGTAEELIISPDKKFVQVVGGDGAEFVDLPKGSQVIPHEQTKKILEVSKHSSKNKRMPIESLLPSYNMGTMDVKTEMPKLSLEQIKHIINSRVSSLSVDDAQGIFDAQNKTGLSALLILSIGIQESGWTGSAISREKHNLWGWNAVNSNPYGSATSWPSYAEAALEFAQKYSDLYYDKRQSKTIYSTGTGNNPSGKGYAYKNDGSIDTQWAEDVASIAETLSKVALDVGEYYTSATDNNNFNVLTDKNVDAFIDSIIKQGKAEEDKINRHINKRFQEIGADYINGEYTLYEYTDKTVEVLYDAIYGTSEFTGLQELVTDAPNKWKKIIDVYKESAGANIDSEIIEMLEDAAKEEYDLFEEFYENTLNKINELRVEMAEKDAENKSLWANRDIEAYKKESTERNKRIEDLNSLNSYTRTSAGKTIINNRLQKEYENELLYNEASGVAFKKGIDESINDVVSSVFDKYLPEFYDDYIRSNDFSINESEFSENVEALNLLPKTNEQIVDVVFDILEVLKKKGYDTSSLDIVKTTENPFNDALIEEVKNVFGEEWTEDIENEWKEFIPTLKDLDDASLYEQIASFVSSRIEKEFTDENIANVKYKTEVYSGNKLNSQNYNASQYPLYDAMTDMSRIIMDYKYTPEFDSKLKEFYKTIHDETDVDVIFEKFSQFIQGYGVSALTEDDFNKIKLDAYLKANPDIKALSDIFNDLGIKSISPEMLAILNKNGIDTSAFVLSEEQFFEQDSMKKAMEALGQTPEGMKERIKEWVSDGTLSAEWEFVKKNYLEPVFGEGSPLLTSLEEQLSNPIASWQNAIIENESKRHNIKQTISQLDQEDMDAFRDSLQEAANIEAELIEKEKESLSERINYYNSMSTLLGKHHSILNNIADEHHNINKELRASQTMYQYLDGTTRQLLFNENDYIALNKELNNIEKKVLNLQDEYERELKYATKEELESITNEYGRQYDMLMKTYEIKKAEFEVEKKRIALNNTLNERNVRMFINGQWQWVANTQDVINAQNEFEDAKYSLEKAERDKSQQNALDVYSRKTDELNTQINFLDSKVEDINDNVDRIVELMEEKPLTVSQAWHNLLNTDSEYVRNIANAIAAPFATLYQDLTGNALGNISSEEYYSTYDKRIGAHAGYKDDLVDLPEDKGYMSETISENDTSLMPWERAKLHDNSFSLLGEYIKMEDYELVDIGFDFPIPTNPAGDNLPVWGSREISDYIYKNVSSATITEDNRVYINNVEVKGEDAELTRQIVTRYANTHS